MVNICLVVYIPYCRAHWSPGSSSDHVSWYIHPWRQRLIDYWHRFLTFRWETWLLVPRFSLVSSDNCRYLGVNQCIKKLFVSVMVQWPNPPLHILGHRVDAGSCPSCSTLNPTPACGLEKNRECLETLHLCGRLRRNSVCNALVRKNAWRSISIFTK